MARRTRPLSRAIHFYIYRQRRPNRDTLAYPAVLLFDDNWDDYGFKTLFRATLIESETADEYEIGEVKILQKNRHVIYTPDLERIFTRLDKDFCSLGQSVRYYRRLRNVSPGLRQRYLRALRDIVADPDIKARFEQRTGFSTSLLRHSGARDALRRGGFYIAAPYISSEPPRFDFRMQLPGATAPHEITFDFNRYAELPNRIILLIGRNGTGKTQLLAHLAHRLFGDQGVAEDETSIRGTAEIIGDHPALSKVIAISYNAFDHFPIPKAPKRRGRKSLFSYKYCGLRNAEGIIDTSELKAMLDDAMRAIETEERLDILENLIGRLLGSSRAEDFISGKRARDRMFEKLSAGQRIIVAIAADIVGFIEEGSILLFDEPETHLHPGLMTTAVAILHDILEEFQSFAVIATHSAILLQQIPRRYVRILRRHDDLTTIGIPRTETFGEDLGELTRRVFELSEPEQDFHTVLDQLVRTGRTAEEVAAMFDRGLPLPAQIYLDSITTDQEP